MAILKTSFRREAFPLILEEQIDRKVGSQLKTMLNSPWDSDCICKSLNEFIGVAVDEIEELCRCRHDVHKRDGMGHVDFARMTVYYRTTTDGPALVQTQAF